MSSINQKTMETMSDAMTSIKSQLEREREVFYRGMVAKEITSILVQELKPIFSDFRKTTEQSLLEYVSAIKKIQISTPPIVETRLDASKIKMPEISTDKMAKALTGAVKAAVGGLKIEPRVNVQPSMVNIPKQKEIKMPEKMSIDADQDHPLPVALVDEKGRFYKAMSSLISQGGGGGVSKNKFEQEYSVGFEQLSVVATSTKLASIPAKADKAVMTVEDATLRYKDNGADPTATEGLKIFIGGVIIINSRDALLNFRGIRTGGTNSELNILYYEHKYENK